MTLDEQDVRLLLHRPAPELKLDLERVLAGADVALRRRRRRRATTVGLLAVALAGVPTRTWPSKNIEQLAPTAPGAGGPALSVVRAAIEPPVPRLDVTAEPYPVLISTDPAAATSLSLTWTSAGQERLVPTVPDRQLRAQDGHGLLVLTAQRCVSRRVQWRL